MTNRTLFLFLTLCLGGCPETHVVRHDGGACDETCSGDTPVCDFATETCVGCVTSGDCANPTPVCDPETKTCGNCLSSEQCSGDTPYCTSLTGFCVECLNNSHCSGDTPSCNLITNECHACNVASDCPSPAASQCNPETRECMPCVVDNDCAHLTTTPLCDEARGTCVECTADTEAARCGANACRRSDGVCTGVERGTVDRCGVCEADSQCMPGHWCIEQLVGGTLTGFACLPETISAQCAISHTTLRPYVTMLNATSIDGTSTSVCAVSSTTSCEAVRDIGVSCVDSTSCGAPDVNDGICTTLSGNPNLCSIPCAIDAQCPSAMTCMTATATCQL